MTKHVSKRNRGQASIYQLIKSYTSAILCILLLKQCTPKHEYISPGDLVGEWESISDEKLPVSYYSGGGGFSMFGPADGRKLIFHNDSTVETGEIPYEKLDRFEILDYKVPFQIHDDTLLLFKLEFNGWSKTPLKKEADRIQIQRISNDTLSFSINNGKLALYRRITDLPDTLPVFDAIIVSTSGCYGRCPINNTMINADGSILFFGERYVDKLGFYTGNVNPKEFIAIQDLFRQADIKNIATDYKNAHADLEQVTITFLKDGKINKTILDYGGKGPSALLWAYVRLRHLHNFVNLKKIPALLHPLREQLSLVGFSKKDMICPFSKSEAFLLWSYLLNGKVSKVAAQPRFKLDFDTNYAWEPRNRQTNTITDIITDGQLYTFILDEKESATIDIGFNFFDRNYDNSCFKSREEYQ